MKIYLLFAIALIFSAQNLFSQKSGFLNLQRGKPEKAHEIFLYFLAKDSNQVASNYGMALIYADSTARFFDWFTAYKYIEIAQKYQKTKPAGAEFSAYFTADSIAQKYQQIDRRLFLWVKQRNSPQIIEKFLKRCPNSPHLPAVKALKAQNTEFRAAKAQNTIAAYENFMKKYPAHAFVPQAKALRDSLVFEKVKTQNTQQAYTRFIKNYPAAQQVRKAKILRATLDSIQIEIGTFRGNESRNFYGTQAPEKLDLIWKLDLGAGKSRVHNRVKHWAGCGWTGQPLLVNEKGKKYLIQGAYDYNLRKIEAKTGKVIWKYAFDDIIKGTGTIWQNIHADSLQYRYVILQGSRYGFENDWNAQHIPSFRAISYISGKELWRMNVKQTLSYSRDTDASPLVLRDTAYIGLENGIFTVFNPDFRAVEMRNGMWQPKLYHQAKLYRDRDYISHSYNLVTEASPTLLNDRIYVSTGSGHIYGYNLKTHKLDWDLFLGADIDGTPVVTHDECLLVSLEKQYIEGKGGVVKIDPSLPPEKAVRWFFPTQNRNHGEWEGGIIGSVATNDHYRTENQPAMAAFIGIDGYLYVVEHDKIQENQTVPGPNLKNHYPTPKLLWKQPLAPSIASPLIVENKIIAPTGSGIYLFEFDKDLNFKKLDFFPGNFEASPIVFDNQVVVGSRNGFLYCLGTKK